MNKARTGLLLALLAPSIYATAAIAGDDRILVTGDTRIILAGDPPDENGLLRGTPVWQVAANEPIYSWPSLVTIPDKKVDKLAGLSKMVERSAVILGHVLGINYLLQTCALAPKTRRSGKSVANSSFKQYIRTGQSRLVP